MKKEINIKIGNIGEATGTIGWLARQEIEMVVGETKSGFRAYWLKIAGKSELGGLEGGKLPDPYCDIVPESGVHGVRLVRCRWQDDLAFGVSFTEAAWEMVTDIDEACFEKFKVIIEKLNESEEKARETLKISIG